MGKTQTLRIPLAVKLADVQIGETSRVQIIRCGDFYSEFYGGFSITPGVLLSMKNNFDSGVRGVDLAIDYAHESDKIAAGWITALELAGQDNCELWADVKWTPRAQDMIKAGEYRYLSADFSFNFVDNETSQEYGPTLFGAGLTNRPFVKGMAPVVELKEGKGTPAMDEKQKIAALEAELAEVKKTEAAKELALAESAKKVAALEAGAAKLAEEKKLAEKKASFDKLLTEGKAVEAQREAFMAGDAAKFAELAKPINLNASGSAQGGTPAAASQDPQKEILKLADQKVKDKKAKDLDEGIRQVLAENKDLAEQYLKATKVN